MSQSTPLIVSHFKICLSQIHPKAMLGQPHGHPYRWLNFTIHNKSDHMYTSITYFKTNNNKSWHWVGVHLLPWTLLSIVYTWIHLILTAAFDVGNIAQYHRWKRLRALAIWPKVKQSKWEEGPVQTEQMRRRTRSQRAYLSGHKHLLGNIMCSWWKGKYHSE